METFIDSFNQKILVHDKKECEGQNCPIHNPSDHHMKNWPLFWRFDRRIFERICEHGIGHPDPDDLAYKEKVIGKEKAKSEGLHGCDGCCYSN